MRKSSVAMISLCLFNTYWILEAPYHLVKLPNYDENIGKTVLIHRSAGEFVLDKQWYIGKQLGDSFFYSSPPYPKGEAVPQFYKITANYRKVGHGLFAGDYNNYLLELINGKSNKRLFFSLTVDCKEQYNLFDHATGVKIDFVCRRDRN